MSLPQLCRHPGRLQESAHMPCVPLAYELCHHSCFAALIPPLVATLVWEHWSGSSLRFQQSWHCDIHQTLHIAHHCSSTYPTSMPSHSFISLPSKSSLFIPSFICILSCAVAFIQATFVIRALHPTATSLLAGRYVLRPSQPYVLSLFSLPPLVASIQRQHLGMLAPRPINQKLSI